MSDYVRPPKSQMDLHQIFKHSFDEHTGALRTTPSDNTHFAVTLNAAEDSITTEIKELRVDQTTQTPVSCVGIKSVALYLKSGTASLEVSPDDDGDFFIPVATTQGQPVQICARRLKLIASGEAVIVGQGA